MVQLSNYENSKRGHIGYFTNEIAAANAYNYHANKSYGEFSLLNVVEYMPKKEWIKFKSGANKTSKYRGVSLNRATGMYLAQIWDTRRNIKIGEFYTEEEAALAWNDVALKLRGNKVKLNIVIETE
ncbi:hypothetical protein [Brevibacillus sp. NRS-1366]|uniref:hypothetical protein n=1 Tax=Brevibacillus sp. NRS-1366 TaxID=3233899 RepID=UPI003D1EFF48